LLTWGLKDSKSKYGGAKFSFPQRWIIPAQMQKNTRSLDLLLLPGTGPCIDLSLTAGENFSGTDTSSSNT
jgi:hypothetical protein